VSASELIFGVSLIVILLAFAAFTGWKQWQSLLQVNADTNLSPEDLKHFRRQAARRIVIACLMVAMAAVLGGALSLGGTAQELGERQQAALSRGEELVLSPDDVQFKNLYATVWIGVLLLLLGLIIGAGVDYLATRRYGRRHYQIIQDERRAMIQDELRRYRRERSERN
jgi:ABC-type Fe3+ transport system permease subunit